MYTYIVERKREKEGGGRRNGSGKTGEKEQREGEGMKLGLILPPQSGAASDSICFKYMDRRVWAVARAMPPKKRERGKTGGYDTPCVFYAKTGPRFYRGPSGTKRERTTPLYDTTRFLGIP